MALSPTDYRKAAQGRRSTANGVTVDTRALEASPIAEGQEIGPLREGSPQDDGALPSLNMMISRSGEYGSWIPGQWLDMIASNADTVLMRDGTGLKLYDALLDDDVAFSAMQQRRMAITSRDWEVAPGDKDDPRSVKAADDFRAMLKALPFDNVTGKLHFGVWYGYAVGEGLFTTKVHDGRLIIWLSDIIVPDRRWFGFTLEGELRFNVNGLGGPQGETLPPNKFIAIRTGASHDFAFYGLGLAHWAYWPIFFKRSALKFWALYLEKFGMPTVGIEFPPEEATDLDKQAKRLAAAVAVGQDRAVLVPWDTLKDKRMALIEAERSGAGSSSYKDFVEAQDEALMRVVLGQPGTSKATKGGLGGDGQAKKDEGVKREIVKSDSDLISEGIHQFAVWLTRWNHGEGVAPPTVYRVLDDPEDLNTTATRDSTLNGIGIRRTEESVLAVYGEGYTYTPPPTPEEQAALDAKVAGAQAPGKAANDNPGRVAVKKAAMAFGVEDYAPLYVSRKLLNAGDLLAWAKGQGFKSVAPADDLHVTVLYSKTPVDWFDMGSDWTSEAGKLTVQAGGPRAVVELGEGAVVLRFASADLKWRHDSMIERGASSDYPEYKPHVTFTYDPGDVDLEKVEPYQGELRFGPEIFEPIEAKPFDPMALDFSAAEDEAIDRLIAALAEDANPVFEAMADELRTNLQGVTTLEGARVAILSAFEAMPVERLAQLTALPMLAERAAASIGKDAQVDA